ncbi:ATP-binding protein [Algoriphagus litoralis]|uniref:ATP-binding protein n=1 Tax=Algoriphagus litoralis TaxID=2202829 RepID=UPI000DBA279E|nr:AAA family ATPase [Algoriphagus litoralis]
MEHLFELYRKLLKGTSLQFQRSLIHKIQWNNRLIGITGARGVGKTTLVLQYLKKEFSETGTSALFASLDHIWFASHSVLDLADQFAKMGGKVLVLDEVHKYPGWSRELKNIYDFYPELKVVFAGSSLLEILNSSADLSRRALMYHLNGMSFREYVNLETGKNLQSFTLDEVITNHEALTHDLIGQFKPYQYFGAYLKQGYYPFSREFGELYNQQLRAIVNLVLEVELPQLRKFDFAYVPKIKQLLSIIADAVPFIPNVTKLSHKIGINRTTLLTYFHYLHESKLTTNLYQSNEGISLLQKPEKLYLENTNLAFALGRNVDIGNLRETFFLNQVGYLHQLTLPKNGDFLIDHKWNIEVGGIGKELPKAENHLVASDGIETGLNSKIPLWIFGFLY